MLLLRAKKYATSLDCPVFETADGHRIMDGEDEIALSNLPGPSNSRYLRYKEHMRTTVFGQPLLQQKHMVLVILMSSQVVDL
jgi:hypothetical protein